MIDGVCVVVFETDPSAALIQRVDYWSDGKTKNFTTPAQIYSINPFRFDPMIR
jgi:hypothetical protein